MAYEIPGRQISLAAGADLSGSQYHFVKESTTADDTVILSTVGASAIGVVQNKPTSGQAATVMLDGVSKVVAGGTVTRGDLIDSDANGAAVTHTTGVVLGQALESVAVNVLVPVQLRRG